MVEEKMKELGFTLPEAVKPLAAYIPAICAHVAERAAFRAHRLIKNLFLPLTLLFPSFSLLPLSLQLLRHQKRAGVFLLIFPGWLK